MRRITLTIISLLFLVNFLIAGETLDQLLERRIALNEDYRDRFTKEAAESPVAKDLQPLEKKLGQQWVDYLTYVKQQKDDKLKAYVIRLELLDEIRGCYYDLEFAENMLEKASLNLEISKWKKELEALNKIVKQDGAGQLPTRPESK